MTHILLRMYIVDETVKSLDEALSAARLAVETLANNRIIDYGVVTDDPDAAWHEDYPQGAYPITSDVANQLIQRDRKYLWGVFNDYMNRLRALLSEFTNEEIFYQKPSPQTLVARGLTDDHLYDKLRAFNDILDVIHPCHVWVHHMLQIWADGSYDIIRYGYELEEAIKEATYIALADGHV